MMVGDPLTSTAMEQQEQRAQCVRFCMTMFLLFSTFFLIRVQQDTYSHNYERRRRKHTDPLLAPEAASLDVVYIHHNVSRGLWVRGETGTGPVLTTAFMAFIPGDSLPSEASAAAAAAASGEGSSSNSKKASPAGYFDSHQTLSRLRHSVPLRGSWAVEVNSPWGPKMHASAFTEIGASGFPSVLAVYRDTRLFRHAAFPGCSSSGPPSSHCFFSLVKLPLSACMTTAPAASGAALPLSWTCSGLSANSIAGSPAGGLPSAVGGPAADELFAEEDRLGCVRLVTGPSLSDINGYASEAVRRPYLKGTANAGAVLQFCGAPLTQLITVDAISGRVFFSQRWKPDAAKRRLEAQTQDTAAGDEAAAAGVGDLAERQRPQSAAAAAAEAEATAAASTAAAAAGAGAEAPNSEGSGGWEEAARDRRSEGVSGASRRLEKRRRSKGLASMCVAYLYLDGFYDDVSQCVPVPTETRGTDALGDPVFMHIDPLTDALTFAAFDPEGQMVLSVHHALSLERKFAARFEGFKSGRLMSAELSSLGKILVTGDEEPYKHRLDVIDVSSGYHESIDMSPA